MAEMKYESKEAAALHAMQRQKTALNMRIWRLVCVNRLGDFAEHVMMMSDRDIRASLAPYIDREVA
jgi:hypothetical protein